MTTIYALSTPPGVGALAVVRISGGLVRHVMAGFGIPALSPRVATLVKVRGRGPGDILDHALVTYFEAPHSYTGEDMLELSLHGGHAVVAGVMDALSYMAGVRMAEPGEFTRRAFLNQKLDLTAAEAVADLIHAETVMQRRQALEQMGGSLRDLYERWRDRLLRACAYLEAHLDFPDEDLPGDILDNIRPALAEIQGEIARHLDDKGRGEIVRDGASVVILGAPNAGKSSLLNALAGRDAAIVSDIAGTTRDVIDVHMDIGGYAVTVADTAGLRAGLSSAGHDAIEAEGIRRALARAAHAHIRIILIDGTDMVLAQDAAAHMGPHTIVCISKADKDGVRDAPLPDSLKGHPVMYVSSQTDEGVYALIQAMKEQLDALMSRGHEGASLTRARHRTALGGALSIIDHALGTKDLPPELLAEELRAAMMMLGRITGRVDVEDLLDVIFRDFCIGK